jgi:predicted N-acetyltransferase YhbS
MVGPIAVSPARQRSGIGQVLTSHAVAAADAAGEDALMLIGDPEYYERFFGFTADHTTEWQVPGPVERRRLLARLRSDRLAHRSGALGPARALQYCARNRVRLKSS